MPRVGVNKGGYKCQVGDATIEIKQTTVPYASHYCPI